MYRSCGGIKYAGKAHRSHAFVYPCNQTLTSCSASPYFNPATFCLTTTTVRKGQGNKGIAQGSLVLARSVTFALNFCL